MYNVYKTINDCLLRAKFEIDFFMNKSLFGDICFVSLYFN